MAILKKLVVVVGGTGNQGSSVVKTFLAEGYHVRALCRNPSSPRALELATLGAEIMVADTNDVNSLIPAVAGAYIVFSVTQFWDAFFAERKQAAENGTDCRRWAYKVEYKQGVNIVDAVATTQDTLAGNGFLVSTLSCSRSCSKGEYTELYHFDSKADVFPRYVQENYPALAAKMSCIHTGYFYHSYRILDWSWLTKLPNGTIEMAFTTSPDKAVPHFLPEKDMGPFTFAVSKMPPGKNYMAAGTVCTWPEWIAAWSKATGVPAVYRHVTSEEMITKTADCAGDKLLGEELVDMFNYSTSPGYDGAMDLLYAADLRKLGLDCPMTSLQEWLEGHDWTAFKPVDGKWL